MIFLFTTLVFGLASGFLYSKWFVKRYLLFTQHKALSFEIDISVVFGKRFVISQAMVSGMRHFLLVALMAILFLILKGNLILWSIGFLFAFWYGVLNAANINGKSE